MKKITALLLVCLLLPACALGDYSPEWTYPISIETLTGDYITLANKDVLLSSSYEPKDLVKLTCKRTSSSAIQMRKAAALALEAMFDDALKEDIALYAHSGYRSYQTQRTMYYNRLEKNNGKDDGVVQYPGASDHQTGLGVDVISYDWIGSSFTAKFALTDEAQWMATHCWEYGYVIRYEEDKEDITGIIYEPWHLRYVGLEVAKYMVDNHLSLEEFTEEWQEAMADFEARGGTAEGYLAAKALQAQKDFIAESDPNEALETGETGEDGDEEVSLFYH